MSRVGVVNEEAAAELFGQDTVGRLIQDPVAAPVEIIGVVRRKATGTSKSATPHYLLQLRRSLRCGPAHSKMQLFVRLSPRRCCVYR